MSVRGVGDARSSARPERRRPSRRRSPTHLTQRRQPRGPLALAACGGCLASGCLWSACAAARADLPPVSHSWAARSGGPCDSATGCAPGRSGQNAQRRGDRAAQDAYVTHGTRVTPATPRLVRARHDISLRYVSPIVSTHGPEDSKVDDVTRRGETLELGSPRAAAREPHARLRAAQAAQRRARLGRVLSYGSLYPALKKMLRAGWITEHVAAPEAGAPVPVEPAAAHRLRAHRPRGRAVRQADVRRRARPPGRTTTSTSASRSSVAPTGRSGCGSSRDAAPGWRSAWHGSSSSCARRPRGERQLRRRSCSATAWSRWSARCAGCRT